ncbi:MAG TPA: DUF917 domain-containing protein [Chloroflexota bacterium]|jgi:hypothetical protein|nr:DUF917 domain-containing protein [Chloroflexota bacterium]
MADSAATLERRQLSVEDIELIALGAGVLGSGGGGSTYLGRLLALSVLRRGRSITMVSPAAVAPGALVVVVAQVGAPVVLAEKLAKGTEAAQACAALEEHLDEPAAAVVCNEIGGINSMIPLLVAAHRDVPLIDADLMGRAFPGLHQDTLGIYGAAPLPISLCDDEGNRAIFIATDTAATERLGRALTMAMGGLSYLAKPMPRDADLDRVLIPGSYSRARAIGVALRRARQEGDLRAIALDAVGGRLLFGGVIHAVERRSAQGPIQGTLSIAGGGDGCAGILRIEFQNEYLLAWCGMELLAATPDVISVVDDETGDPVSTEALQVGLPVVVLHLSADARLTTPEALRRVGPAAFGYEAQYHPINRS